MQNKPSRSLGFTLVEVIAGIGLISILVLVIYFAITNLHRNNIPSEVSSPRPTLAPIASPHSYHLDLKELGVSISLPNTFTGLTYSISHQTSASGQPIVIAAFSTSALTALDPMCASNSSMPPLGDLRRYSGTYNASDQTTSQGKLEKQFADFYITSESPQAACSHVTSTQASAISAFHTFMVAYTTTMNIIQ
jgi:hypothetical protein